MKEKVYRDTFFENIILSKRKRDRFRLNVAGIFIRCYSYYYLIYNNFILWNENESNCSCLYANNIRLNEVVICGPQTSLPNELTHLKKIYFS